MNNKALPHVDTVVAMESALKTNLRDELAAATAPRYEVFLAAPMTSVSSAEFEAIRGATLRVVEAVELHASIYWAGRNISSPDDFTAPDIAAEKNLGILKHCRSFLYLQLGGLTRPPGALVELGIALGWRLNTTIIAEQVTDMPYILNAGFMGVAARSAMLPNVRIYEVEDIDEAVRLIARNGRPLLGLE